MTQQLASKFCESLGMSVILCRDAGAEQFRCLSSHLCGGAQCTENGALSDQRTNPSPDPGTSV